MEHGGGGFQATIFGTFATLVVIKIKLIFIILYRILMLQKKWFVVWCAPSCYESVGRALGNLGYRSSSNSYAFFVFSPKIPCAFMEQAEP